jgi:predicted nucleic acid-binding protein
VLKDLFSVLPESSSTLDTWEHLVTMHRVSGKNSHDARLVAVMRQNGVEQILTFNTQDFTRYQDINIQALHPNSL